MKRGLLVCVMIVTILALYCFPGQLYAQNQNKDKIRKAVLASLDWLKRHQNNDGSWDCDGFPKKCDPTFPSNCDGWGTVTEADPAITGLVVMAFLGAGFQPEGDSDYSDTVKKGLDYLLRLQDEDGYFAKNRKSHFYFYGHAIATTAVAKAHILTGNAACWKAAHRGVQVILDVQNDHPEIPGQKYGWRYFPKDGDNDTSVTTWMAVALSVGSKANIRVPKSAFDGVRNWLDFVTGKVYFRVGYQSPGGSSAIPSELRKKFRNSENCTAMALLCRMLLRENKTSAALRAGVALLSQDLPDWNFEDGAIDFYYWYYGTYAMHAVGGSAWTRWESAVMKAILDNQDTKNQGCACGSWDPKVAKWGGRGGRVYATAINCLTLEVYDNNYTSLPQARGLEPADNAVIDRQMQELEAVLKNIMQELDALKKTIAELENRKEELKKKLNQLAWEKKLNKK
ncbi:hypothetical protein ACFL54_02100 [Planctomycetota bacterium]